MNGLPMTPEEAAQAVANMEASMRDGGLWNKVCIHCNESCGGRLAEYGKPTPVDLQGVCCPQCDIPREGYNGNDHIRLVFVPSKTAARP